LQLRVVKLVWENQGARKMTNENRAELYTNPGGKFIRADSLPRILAHWRSFRRTQKQTHFIKYGGELYVGEEVDKLQTAGIGGHIAARKIIALAGLSKRP
jgi:hypothetical protein